MTDFPQLKVKALVNFPAQAYGNVGITVNKTAGAFYLNLDYTKFSILPTPSDLSAFCTLIWNSVTNSYQLAPTASGVTRVVTVPGAVTIAANDRVVAINKTPGSATAVSLPLASTKVGPVRISDFKRDAATNNISIAVTAPDLIQGQAGPVVLNVNGASIELYPIPGVGYST